MRQLTRRGFVTAVGAAVLPMTAKAQPASPAPGEWTFTDDRQQAIALPDTPRRVAAMAYAAQSLHDFGYTVHAYYGPNAGSADNGEFSIIGDLDLTSLPYLGDYGSYDLEGFISEEIDLVVDFSYRNPGADSYLMWFLYDDEADVAALAPTLGIAMWNVSARESIARFGELAAALGADTSTPRIAADKAAFEASLDALKAATAARPEITVAVIRQTDTGFLVPPSTLFGNLILYRECGVTFVGEDEARLSYEDGWYEYSPEEVGMLSADVILTFAPVTGNPVYDSLPAVTAGQTGTWDSFKRMSYRGAQPTVQALADLIANAEKVA